MRILVSDFRNWMSDKNTFLIPTGTSSLISSFLSWKLSYEPNYMSHIIWVIWYDRYDITNIIWPIWYDQYNMTDMIWANFVSYMILCMILISCREFSCSRKPHFIAYQMSCMMIESHVTNYNKKLLNSCCWEKLRSRPFWYLGIFDKGFPS